MADKDTQTRRPLAATDSNSSFFNTVLLKDSAPVKKVASLPVPAYISSKRKAEVIEDKDEDEEDVPITLNCDQIRRKIRTFLNKGEMNVTEFTKAIGVNSNSYGRFMSYKGPYTGCDNGTYGGAFHFFRRREARGLKVTKKKVKKDEQAKELDVSAIKLLGEEDVAVEVYDSCDEIRRKINAYLREPSVTQAGFLREIAKTYSDGRRIQSKVLNDFLSKKGATAGNTSAPFYASYVFFEKKRIREGKERSKHRLEMERRNPGGLDTSRRLDRVWCLEGERPVQDAYGGFRFVTR